MVLTFVLRDISSRIRIHCASISGIQEVAKPRGVRVEHAITVDIAELEAEDVWDICLYSLSASTL